MINLGHFIAPHKDATTEERTAQYEIVANSTHRSSGLADAQNAGRDYRGFITLETDVVPTIYATLLKARYFASAPKDFDKYVAVFEITERGLQARK